MMELKTYQQETLRVLRQFLEESRVAGPKAAYERIVKQPEQQKRLGAYGGAYRPLNNLENVPYCCLRLPTGGGKTILGAHAIKAAQEAWIEKDYPVVLWLVPSNTIRTQTVDALKKPGHPYRAVLDEAFAGRVRVFDVADFETIRPTDLRDSLCLIVGTIQTLRVDKTEGRKVYAHHEALQPHFAGVPARLEGLEVIEDGKPGAGTIKFSLANLLHLHRPLMIVDEAHNAVTGLSREVQLRVNPCAIIEFTATPKPNSNTLHNVKALELKDAEMIKLPIVLGEHQTWQSAVLASIQERATLEEEAKGESRYIRPIVLFQAEDKGREVTEDVLLEFLTKDGSIARDQIAIVTGDQRELDNIDLFSSKEPAIRYIITKEALKEGWDCSFAYVFCSVANVTSATDVEQLLGRVMRMPYAARRKSEKLNRAYAHVPETRFGASAVALKDKLVTKMGFEDGEAEANMVAAQPQLLDEQDMFGRARKPKPKLELTVKPNETLLQHSTTLAEEGIVVAQDEKGQTRLVTSRPVTPKARAIIEFAIAVDERSGFHEAEKRFDIECRKELSPAERGETFLVPRLAAHHQGELVFVDDDYILDDFEWSIAETPARLEKGEFDLREDANSFQIDLDGERLRFGQADEQFVLPADFAVTEWTQERLAIWLDRQNHNPAFSQSDLLAWTTELVRYLTKNRGFSISQLHRLKFIISRKVAEKIEQARRTAKQKAHQLLLFEPTSRVEVSFNHAVEFRDSMFFGQPVYRGSYVFRRNFFGPDGVGAFDGALAHGEGEEFECAKALDSVKDVKHWVRNLSKHPNAFWLPLAQNKTYPDFVAELNDGRILVVEYKGELTVQAAHERRTIGEKWEQASGGKCLFIIVEKDNNGLDIRAQLQAKVQQ